jgi:hypothetical protein
VRSRTPLGSRGRVTSASHLPHSLHTSYRYLDYLSQMWRNLDASMGIWVWLKQSSAPTTPPRALATRPRIRSHSSSETSGQGCASARVASCKRTRSAPCSTPRPATATATASRSRPRSSRGCA